MCRNFIKTLLPPFYLQAQAQQIGFNFEVAEKDGEFLFDSDKLEKILHNLLRNALKFTPDGGSVEMVVSQQPSPDGKTIFKVQVADTGIGISAEHLPHIFERFYQVNDSSTRRFEGTGIGLSLVKEFTELMGGTIVAQSRPGGGAEFTLGLPLLPATGSETAVTVLDTELLETALPEPEKTSAMGGEKPLVLVADDNMQLRGFITGTLSPYYRVITAVTVRQA